MNRVGRGSSRAESSPKRIDSVALTARCTGLGAAARAAHGRLPEGPVRHAEHVLEHVGQRRRFSDDLTVVALAGPTGAGKSSIFNAVVGHDVARVAATRPTTGEATAALWASPESADGLLDWLGVRKRHVVTGSSPASPGLTDLTGLILLDLPDIDSTITTHREQVDRLVARVDIMIWVLDPQKYADAIVHDAYLTRFARHDDVTIVLLNQVDRLGPADAGACREHLSALVTGDGLSSARILAASARTGAGLDELIEMLGEAVRERTAAIHRLAADVAEAADGLRAAARDSGDGPRPVPRGGAEPLTTALAEAAGVELVERAVRDSVRRWGARATGWPAVRWAHRFRRDPVARLRLGQAGASPALTRTSLPSASPVALAKATSAARDYAALAAQGAPPAWVRSTRTVAVSAAQGIGPHLETAVARAEVGSPRHPRWWTLVGLLQWLLIALAGAGAAWLLGLAALGVLAIPTADPPTVGGLALPSVLLLGGCVVGIVLAALARAATRVTANHAAARARAAVTDRVAQVSHDRVMGPVSAELGTLSQFRHGITAAIDG